MKRAHAAGLALLAVLGTGVAIVPAQQQQAFPHDEHARLFPLCGGCHDMDGARAAYYPPATSCARCHDGQQTERVTWSAPSIEPTNLQYNHAAHTRATANEQPPLDCGACHGTPGRGRMDVHAAETASCFSCHAHPARNHLVDATCSTCHVSLVQSTLTPQAVAALPRPPDHDRADFLMQHGTATESATCEFCHARNQCAACHVNAASLPAITRLAAAPPSMGVPLPEARYPEPASHGQSGFATNHAEATSTASCATCHTRESCMTCHTGRLPAAVAALTPASEAGAQGASTQRAMPESHAGPAFTTSHGGEAATDPGACTMCHTTGSCTSCHDAPVRAVYHPPNFMAGHASAVYSARLECSNCHDNRVFCRDCHMEGGQTSRGRLFSTVYHDAEPLWLLRHGGAARRGLESCTSCHTQRDCLSCHSELGAFKVSPHGPDFDARAAQQRNPIICRACHLGDPLRRG